MDSNHAMRLALAILLTLPLLGHAQIPFGLSDPALTQVTSPLRNNLVGGWRLEESTGTRLDESGYGNHLTSNNSVGQATGVSTYTGNAAAFVAASNQYLSKTDNSSLPDGSTSFSVALWVYLTDLTSLRAFAGQYDTGANQRGWDIYYNNVPNRFAFNVSTNGTGAEVLLADAFGAPSATTWYFIYAQFNRTTRVASVSVNNGSFNSTAALNASAFNSTASLTIGSVLNSGAPLAPHNGRIDEVGIWTRLLTADEITKLYNAGLGTHFPWSHP